MPEWRHKKLRLTATIVLLFMACLMLSFSYSPDSQVQNRKANILQFESRLNNIYWSNSVKEKYVYLLVKANASTTNITGNTPINISLVLDRSGSMSGAKLKYVKKAAYFVIDQLYQDDILSIITYDDQIQIVSPADFARKKKALKKVVDEIFVDGATNLSGGLLEGAGQVKVKFRDGYVNRVLLLSDGLANRGITDPKRLKDTVQLINRWENITLSTFGIGTDFDEDLMEDLSLYGGGNYYYVEEAERIPLIFMEELMGLQTIVAQNVQAVVEFPSEYLSLESVDGYPFYQEGNKAVVLFNDAFAEEEKVALLKFKVKRPPFRSLTFTSHFSYQNILDNLAKESDKQMVMLTPTSNEQMFEKNFDEVVLQNIALFKANATLDNAIEQVDGGFYEEAENAVLQNKKFLEEQFKKFVPDSTLLKQYEATVTYLTHITQLEDYNDYEKKVMQKLAKSKNYLLRKRRY